ncbi:hypothetical protein BEP19_03320 [Ammoniphilus oxalaticus]|uniref:Transglutaminase-like domain-containing protein n=1 Tax=Ammoniphilus oxalaticus TaxID=66863 RepID=A0A419SNV8_9BACL|nr:transglutaminase domain-containing protein [Ammoniphilus oxalaticus]RKD25968.1 hypothetical protein BEP19_03320 [Ammoniphilus oxalaticus]
MNKKSIKVSLNIALATLILFVSLFDFTSKVASANYNLAGFSKEELQDMYPNSYASIYEALSTVNPNGFFDDKEVDYLDVKHLIQAILDTDPNLFYIKNWITYSNRDIEFNFRYTEETISKKNELLDKRTDAILKNIIQPHYSDYDKVKAIYNYVVLNTSYDYEGYITRMISNDSYTTFGTIMYGIAVCDGYTRTINYLLEKVGIESIYIVGITNSGGLHSWNMVELDGSFYHLDVTFADTSSDKDDFVNYNYFLRNSEYLLETRTWDQSKYPAADNDYAKTKLK